MRSYVSRTSPTLLYALALMSLFSSLSAQEKKKLTYDQIFKGAEPRLTKSLPNITGWMDDSHYLELKKKEGDDRAKVYSVDVKTGEESVYSDLEQYKTLVDSGISVSNPASRNKSSTRLIYVKDGDLYFLDVQKKEFRRLTKTEASEKNATLSADGSGVAFTRDRNLFSIDVNTGKEFQYTTDASDVVYNGWSSWVYMEEVLGRATQYKAFWWSPDGKRLAFFRFDDTPVPVFPLLNAEGVHGSVENQRYPKAGDPNPEVRVGIVPVGGGSVAWADFNQKDDQYFGTPFWALDSRQLVVQWMNRGQDTLKLYSIDPATGKKQQIYVEHQPSWVDWFASVYFLRNGSGFIINSDKDGWHHLYLHGMDGTLKTQITHGKWNVVDLLFMDESARLVYFTAKKESSTRTDFYKISIGGGAPVRLSFGEYTHSIELSPMAGYFITTCSNISTPPSMALLNTSGEVIRELGNSKMSEFDNYILGKTELFRVQTPDGYNLPVSWTLPTDFDPNKKYPVLISVYGGPDRASVSDSWQGMRPQWWAMEGIIQMSMDHRGSDHFGKESIALMHRHLGKWEMNDYIEVVKWLRTQPFIDSTKICITGSSYGGYVTCMALTYGAEYFTHGVASLSVTDWRLYDSHYTEMFMDTPAENPEGYEEGSVMTYASKYKGMLMIMHGTMDDNVHMQNTMQLVAALEDQNKHFELMIYPGGRHGWGGRKAAHSRNEAYRFYYQYLLGREFPENLFK
jgi:dipeptidyl-peptidase-4